MSYDERDYDRAEHAAEESEDRENEAREAFADGFKAHARHGAVEVECCLDKPALVATDPEAVYDTEWGIFYCGSECFENHGMHNGDHYEPQEDFYADLGIHCSDLD